MTIAKNDKSFKRSNTINMGMLSNAIKENRQNSLVEKSPMRSPRTKKSSESGVPKSPDRTTFSKDIKRLGTMIRQNRTDKSKNEKSDRMLKTTHN